MKKYFLLFFLFGFSVLLTTSGVHAKNKSQKKNIKPACPQYSALMYDCYPKQIVVENPENSPAMAPYEQVKVCWGGYGEYTIVLINGDKIAKESAEKSWNPGAAQYSVKNKDFRYAMTVPMVNGPKPKYVDGLFQVIHEPQNRFWTEHGKDPKIEILPTVDSLYLCRR